jgi:hypothetical protein
VVPPGKLTVVVSAVPDESAALADRLGRYLPRRTSPAVPEDDGELKGKAARRARADRKERIAAAEAEDRVLIEDGRVVASGAHHDLLEGDPRYARVVSRAMDEDADDPPPPELPQDRRVPAAARGYEHDDDMNRGGAERD